MTDITMGSFARGSSLGSVARKFEAVRENLVERYRRWRQYRTTMAELDQYADDQLAELGIAPADVARIAQDAAGR